MEAKNKRTTEARNEIMKNATASTRRLAKEGQRIARLEARKAFMQRKANGL
jgi:hypothetical protein